VETKRYEHPASSFTTLGWESCLLFSARKKKKKKKKEDVATLADWDRRTRLNNADGKQTITWSTSSLSENH
jgi:hypothetical protein